jgi:hypothetical protein
MCSIDTIVNHAAMQIVQRLPLDLPTVRLVDMSTLSARAHARKPSLHPGEEVIDELRVDK